jgi:hypothetical protein
LVNGFKEIKLVMGIPQDQKILKTVGTLPGAALLGWRKWQPTADEPPEVPKERVEVREGGDQIKKFILDDSKMNARVIPGNPPVRLT